MSSRRADRSNSSGSVTFSTTTRPTRDEVHGRAPFANPLHEGIAALSLALLAVTAGLIVIGFV